MEVRARVKNVPVSNSAEICEMEKEEEEEEEEGDTQPVVLVAVGVRNKEAPVCGQKPQQPRRERQ